MNKNCTDCDRPKDDINFHFDAPGHNVEAGLHWYKEPQIMSESVSAAQNHAIDIEVAKIAKAEGWKLPDANLIEFGVKVWNRAKESK